MSGPDADMAGFVLDVDLLLLGVLVPQSEPAKILELARQGKLNLLLSEDMIAEARRVLIHPRVAKPLGLAREELEDFLDQLRDFAGYVRLSGQDACGPAGDECLEAAQAGAAQAIITRDRELLAQGHYQGIPIMGVAQFLAGQENP